jgi:hypothetical protein
VSHLDSGFHQNPATPVLFTYRGVSVRVGPDGLIFAQDMHHAAKAPTNKECRLWLRNKGTQDFATALERKPENSTVLGTSPVYRVEPGRNGGTWLCREMAIAYAAYLDADFHVFVVRVFLAVGDGKLVPAGAIPAEILAEFAAMKAQLAELTAIKQQLAEIRNDFGEVVRPIRVRESVRELHRKIVSDKHLGLCPCCFGSSIASFTKWTKGNHFVHRYYGVRRATLADTWPVCLACFHQLIRDKEFLSDSLPAFMGYQAKVKLWLRERQPDFIRDGMRPRSKA